MVLRLTYDQALDIWRGAALDAVRGGRPDLTMRQMAVVLTVYLKPPPHTVRGLAAELNVSKPAVVRALDRLEELDFVRRREDPEDKRNVLIERTVKGSVYLREAGDMIAASALRGERDRGTEIVV
ncbi:MAG TPA: MarR family transcriptional regulator [Alphaproteobacteria bacterium]|jgi:DNA-binding MarR family transcriptional regulator|nr:MarR family transcriptional regulator [Alphaproteobacteria bacterium]